MVVPADGHVHSQWSWDAPQGDMERTCARAVELGLPAVAFTEHVDHTHWMITAGEVETYPNLRPYASSEGTIVPPSFDRSGYLQCLQRCREMFPGLRIISGVELGEPHRHPEQVAQLLDTGGFERVLGSLHSLPFGHGFAEPPHHFRHRPADEVVRDYLLEIARLVNGSGVFGVLAHLDYPLRYWPQEAGPFDVTGFEEEFRHALRALAGSARLLEVNTRGRLLPEVVRWWREEGGEGVTFGSDAHQPQALAHRFAEAVAMVETHGFRPGRHPHDVWIG